MSILNPCEGCIPENTTFKRAVLRLVPVVRGEQGADARATIGVYLPVHIEGTENQEQAQEIARNCARYIINDQCLKFAYSEFTQDNGLLEYWIYDRKS